MLGRGWQRYGEQAKPDAASAGLRLHQAVLPAGVTVYCNNSIPECKHRRVGSLNTNGLCCRVDGLRKISHIFSCSWTAIVYLW